MALTPYQQQTQNYERTPEGGNPAETEGWALLEAAKRLAAAIVHGPDDDPETKEKRKAALRLNWRLWTIFQAELTQERPDLSREVQINMLTLCQFVDRHTVGALLNPTSEALSTLIDINRNIASGMLQVPEDAGQGAVDEPGQPVAELPPTRFDAEV